MGEPDFSPATIPLAVDGEADTYRTRIDDGTIIFRCGFHGQSACRHCRGWDRAGAP
jgi:hypothetical protein